MISFRLSVGWEETRAEICDFDPNSWIFSRTIITVFV